MPYNWINAEDYTMETLLFFDRWILHFIMSEDQCRWYDGEGRSYISDMAKALSRYPYLIPFCKRKAPECTDFLNKVLGADTGDVNKEEAREAETAILSAIETFVVYAWPEAMEKVNYIRNWDPRWLYSLVDLGGKIVLDIGAGTGRLAFAAAKLAKRVYASEPCDMLREYMRDKIRREGIVNMRVLDGEVTQLPCEDDTFDLVMSGHVVGDAYDEEIAEMTRVTKGGGYIVCCNGDDEFKRPSPNQELVSSRFEFFVHESREGGIIYDYRKLILK